MGDGERLARKHGTHRRGFVAELASKGEFCNNPFDVGSRMLGKLPESRLRAAEVGVGQAATSAARGDERPRKRFPAAPLPGPDFPFASRPRNSIGRVAAQADRGERRDRGGLARAARLHPGAIGDQTRDCLRRPGCDRARHPGRASPCARSGPTTFLLGAPPAARAAPAVAGKIERRDRRLGLPCRPPVTPQGPGAPSADGPGLVFLPRGRHPHGFGPEGAGELSRQMTIPTAFAGPRPRPWRGRPRHLGKFLFAYCLERGAEIRIQPRLARINPNLCDQGRPWGNCAERAPGAAGSCLPQPSWSGAERPGLAPGPSPFATGAGGIRSPALGTPEIQDRARFRRARHPRHAPSPSERPKIASAFWNRLAEGVPSASATRPGR